MCGVYIGHDSVKLIKNSIYSANVKETAIINVINQLATIFLFNEISIDFQIIKIPIIIGIIPNK